MIFVYPQCMCLLSIRVRCYIASLEGNELPNPQVSCHSVQIRINQMGVLFSTVLAGICFQTNQAGSGKSRHVLCCISQCYCKFMLPYYRDTRLLRLLLSHATLLIGLLSNWNGYVIQQLVSQTKAFNSIQRKRHK